MGNRSAADVGGLLAGRGPGTSGGAGTPAGLAEPGAVAALAGGVLLIGTVLAGNSLVCVSVAAERALQTPTNYFIVSLAAADLLLALLVLPLFVYSEVSAPTPAPRTPTSPWSPVPAHAGAVPLGRWPSREPPCCGGCRGAAPGPRTTGASVPSVPSEPILAPSGCPSATLLSVCPPSLFCPSLS